jgi:cytoskeletal protein RodZ
MHDDPTRIMGQPEQPGGGRPRGNMRLLIAGLIAVIAGLVVAIVVIASEGDGEPTVTTLPTTAETTATAPTATETTAPETTETTTPTTETTTEPTTTAPPTTTPEEEEETGSGGIPAE